MLYALISDVHANRTALKAVEEVVKQINRNGSQVHFWLLGDLLGYGPAVQAAECLFWLRFDSRIVNREEPTKSRWLVGNHDAWAVSPSGNFRLQARLTLSAQRKLLAQSPQYRDDWDWFQEEVKAILADPGRSLPIEVFGDDPGANLALAFTHGSFKKILHLNDYVYPWQHLKLVADMHTVMERVTARTLCLIHGHTHFPVLARLVDDHSISYDSIRYGKPIALGEGCLLINPGSVGQPRDGDPRASFAILDTEQRTVTFYRVPYDVYAVADLLRSEKNGCLAQEEREAYDALIRQLLQGDGGDLLSMYHKKVYMPPEWDLRAVDTRRPGA